MYLPARLIIPALAVLLTACAQTQNKPVAVFSPAAEAELEQIRSAFNEGDYSTVIRQVGRSSTLPAAAPDRSGPQGTDPMGTTPAEASSSAFLFSGRGSGRQRSRRRCRRGR